MGASFPAHPPSPIPRPSPSPIPRPSPCSLKLSPASFPGHSLASFPVHPLSQSPVPRLSRSLIPRPSPPASFPGLLLSYWEEVTNGLGTSGHAYTDGSLDEWQLCSTVQTVIHYEPRQRRTCPVNKLNTKLFLYSGNCFLAAYKKKNNNVE